MGLKNKALQYKEKSSSFSVENLEKLIGGRTINSSEIQQLKNDIDDYLNSLKTELDRKLLDMQTLFEIGKEINSTLHLLDLMQIIIFTLMGQFMISDVAIFVFSDNEMRLVEKKGFKELFFLEKEPDFYDFLKNADHPLLIQELLDFPNQYQALSRNKAGLLVPVQNKEKLVGIFILGEKGNNEPYSPGENSFIYTLASLSGIAMDNARLYEALEDANKQISKKYNELSTLYEISKVINSSDDFQAVLALITETITTGFGVKQALLFTYEEDLPVIKKIIGLPDKILNQTISLLPEEENLFLKMRSGILTAGKRINGAELPGERYLFMPLVSSGTKIGGILIFNFENYIIQDDNNALINLFSIIASQIAPPLALTRQISFNKEKSDNPFDAVLNLIRNEIEKARLFGVTIHLAMLKLNNLSKYREHFGDAASTEQFQSLRDKIGKLLPNTARAVRYASNKILIILPEVFESDLHDLEDSIKFAVEETFKNKDKIDAGPEISVIDCSDESRGFLSLLSLIE